MPSISRQGFSLCNVNSKIIAKSLANRLKHHLPAYIHPSQQACILGTRISKNIILAHEIANSFTLTSWATHHLPLLVKDFM